MRSRAWLTYALVTTASWGVWGAFTGLPANHGFPETLIYAVWAVTLIPKAAVSSPTRAGRFTPTRPTRRPARTTDRRSKPMVAGGTSSHRPGRSSRRTETAETVLPEGNTPARSLPKYRRLTRQRGAPTYP